ncbi:MAG: hypothetical protein PHR35_03180 [Kiritimatiellae bacterium]|nr:hypothetical protein [Kiritimatiellia bacterium]
MIKEILKAIGIGGVAMACSCSQSPQPPYKGKSAALIYNLLFCDRLELFQNHKGAQVRPWSVLFAEKPDLEEVASIASDTSQESRVRVLAFHLLRKARCDVKQKELLGTIVEVGLPEGLDTLAVFTDGGARYINHSGKMVMAEGTPNVFDSEIKRVLAASQPIVAAIGPWDRERLPPPPDGTIRMTFLVSDGLYFGQGPMDVMQEDPMAAPLINAATALLMKMVEKTTDGQPAGGAYVSPSAGETSTHP